MPLNMHPEAKTYLSDNYLQKVDNSCCLKRYYELLVDRETN